MNETTQTERTTFTLASALQLVEDLADEITELLDVAAIDADVEISVTSERNGSARKMLALDLVNRLVAGGWSFSHDEADEATR